MKPVQLPCKSSFTPNIRIYFVILHSSMPAGFCNATKIKEPNPKPQNWRICFRKHFSSQILRLTAFLTKAHGEAFVKRQFYPNLERYVQLVRELQRRGVEVKTLVTVRNRIDFLVSYFLDSLSWQGTPKTFHEFANNAVTPSFSWQSVEDQLERLPVTYLPQEAMEKHPEEFVACINKFYETNLLEPEDLSDQVNSA